MISVVSARRGKGDVFLHCIFKLHIIACFCKLMELLSSLRDERGRRKRKKRREQPMRSASAVQGHVVADGVSNLSAFPFSLLETQRAGFPVSGTQDCRS